MLAWSVTPCLLALLVGYLARGSGPSVGVYLASTVPALAVMAPMVWLFFQAMMLGKSPVPLPLAARAASRTSTHLSLGQASRMGSVPDPRR